MAFVPSQSPHQESWWLSSKEPFCQCRRHGFSSWIGKISWIRKWQPTPVLLPGNSHGQRSLVGNSPWGRKELDMTEQLNNNSLLIVWIPAISQVSIPSPSLHFLGDPHSLFLQKSSESPFTIWLRVTSSLEASLDTLVPPLSTHLHRTYCSSPWEPLCHKIIYYTLRPRMVLVIFISSVPKVHSTWWTATQQVKRSQHTSEGLCATWTCAVGCAY